MSVEIFIPPKKRAESDWAGHPDALWGDSPEEMKYLVEHRGEIEIWAMIEDDESSYDFDDFALVRLGHRWYLLNAAGCSCPSHSESWSIDIDPTSLEEIRAFLLKGEYSGYTVKKRQMDQFVQAFDAAQVELLRRRLAKAEEAE